nr:hypothetical protein [Hyphomicrobium sp.]
MRSSHRRSASFKAVSAKNGPALVALLAAGAIGLGFNGVTIPARAEAPVAGTVATPFGRAPLSFADLVEKVKPSVVSVSVVNDGSGGAKVADNKEGPQGQAPGRGGALVSGRPLSME